MKKASSIFFNALPVLIMILLIAVINSDYLLSVVYVAIIAIAFTVKKEKNEIAIFLFGFFIMMVSEYFFISTGVEIFIRHSLFGIMPIWLPFLWGYGFIAIKRGVAILGR